MIKAPSLVLPGVTLILAGYACHASGIDLQIAKAVYTHFDGFPRNSFLLKAIMHEGMRNIITGIFSLLVLILIWDGIRPFGRLRDVRGQLRIFVACAVLFIGGVAALKTFTTPACPWDLTVLGGDRPSIDYADIFRTAVFGKGHCFPAGHSTSGYVWLCLAFVFADSRKNFTHIFLGLLPIGLSLSATQILRGAHFLSHELTTLGIALITFSILPALFARKHDSTQAKAIPHAL